MTTPSPFLTGRRLAIAAALGLAVVAIVAVVMYAVSGPSIPPTVDDPRPPAAGEEPFRQTDLAQVKTALGPFQTIPVSADSPTPDTKAPAVLILNQDGSTLASQNWTVTFDSASWQQGDLGQIKSLSVVNGYATFGTNLNRTFMVKCNQPFIFEDTPQQVSVVDAQGNIWSITTARAEASRQPLK